LEQAAIVEERRRLARELHDSVTQTVYSLTLLAEAGRDLIAAENHSLLDGCLQDLQVTSLQALREMRLLLFELRDPEMKDKNLIEALQNRLEAVERRSGIAVEFCVEGSVYLSNDYQEELYQIASEALNNVLKHAKASRVRIMIESSPEGFAMEIEDNGCGFDRREIPIGGMGLENMQERILRLDGIYSFASEPGKGTRIGVQFGQRESHKQ
jgi:signal transduction histidine kinase